jgi:uncharacterized protein (UPF0332 family)
LTDKALARSRQELGAARLLAESGFATQAISRAYYAAFYAAQEALLVLGETRSKHAGVLSAFVRLVVREGGVDEERGRLLRSLFERRNDADYGGIDASREDADEAIRDAEQLVDAVEGWLEQTRR